MTTKVIESHLFFLRMANTLDILLYSAFLCFLYFIIEDDCSDASVCEEDRFIGLRSRRFGNILGIARIIVEELRLNILEFH